MNFMEYMNQQKPVSRWFVLKIALIGAICGAALATVFVMGALGQ